MIRRAALCLLLLTTPVAADEATTAVAQAAAQASSDLQASVAGLEAATSARDRVAALTRTITAYENGLAALREALRQAELREAALALQFTAKRDRVAQLLGVLTTLDADPGPLLLLHPAGPLGTVRSGMILADVTPALQAEAEVLRADLTDLANLRALQESAGDQLSTGLQQAQAARFALSQAMSDRTTLPKRFTEDPEVLQALIDSADTLAAFAGGLALDADDSRDFAGARGTLPLPVLGRLILKPGEADATGVSHPGLTLATRPLALVTAPWPATIRYRGPLLNYGNVMILEPGGGYLLILAGLDTVYGEVGEVIAAGAPLGLMGGGLARGGLARGSDATAAEADILVPASDGGGADGTETLYLELRLDAEPVDPTAWFAVLAH